jgi:glycosyltransferase involved in cell wall biosynthesis
MYTIDMKLSFIIPAYNEEAYLPMCLEAVLKEKQKGLYDMEIIVVNNASTDRTKEVASSFPGVKVVDEPKKGLSAARQAGFLASSGDLIANIDSDSVLTPGWIDTVMDRFSKNPKLVALSGPFIFHDLPIYSNLIVRLQYLIDYYFYFVNRFVLRISSLLQGGNFVIRRSALEKIGGFNPDFSFWGEDTHIAKKLNPLGPVVFTFKLPIYSSGRRLKEEGILTMCYKYSMNFFWTIFFNKPFLTSHIDIRKPAKDQSPFKTSVQDFKRAMLYTKVSLSLLVFGLMGGGAYLYDRTVENVVPITASAAVVSIESPTLTQKIHTSITKLHEKIKTIEDKFDSDK